jgi:hypothetical protein
MVVLLPSVRMMTIEHTKRQQEPFHRVAISSQVKGGGG